MTIYVVAMYVITTLGAWQLIMDQCLPGAGAKHVRMHSWALQHIYKLKCASCFSCLLHFCILWLELGLVIGLGLGLRSRLGFG